MDPDYNKNAFGIAWMAISCILELWWIIAVIVSAVSGDGCGWKAATGQDWFVILCLIVIFLCQFGIGQCIGIIDFQMSQEMTTVVLPKSFILILQAIAGFYVILNILAIVNLFNEGSYDCWTGLLMLITIIVNLLYSIVTSIFSCIVLPQTVIVKQHKHDQMQQVPQQEEDEVEYLKETVCEVTGNDDDQDPQSS
eukprot:133921_1